MTIKRALGSCYAGLHSPCGAIGSPYRRIRSLYGPLLIAIVDLGLGPGGFRNQRNFKPDVHKLLFIRCREFKDSRVIFSEAPLPDPTPTPPNGPETDPKQTRNGPKRSQTDPKRTETHSKWTEIKLSGVGRPGGLSGGGGGPEIGTICPFGVFPLFYSNFWPNLRPIHVARPIVVL